LSKPLLLDLFCGAGGASVGYERAGFVVVGVDINPQPNYPYTFVQKDVMKINWYDLRMFDLIHASPPCQYYSYMSACRPELASKYPDLIETLREKLNKSNKYYVIENVVGAPLRDPIMLCGQMFGADLYRHRLFESNRPLKAPQHPEHMIPASKAGHWKPGTIMSVAGHIAPIAHARKIMGIDWMNRAELAEAIPPAYTEYIGRQFIERYYAITP